MIRDPWESVRIENTESGSCIKVIETKYSGQLNASQLLNIAFGRAWSDRDDEDLESESPGSTVFCLRHKKEIFQKINEDGEISETRVLGTFDSPVMDWTFDTERKQLCAGLRDGTVALIRIIDN